MSTDLKNLTALLEAHQNGDQKAWSKLFEASYGDLRRIARNLLAKEAHASSIQATALVHEAYLRLNSESPLKDRPHFFALIATLMRHILVDHARRHLSAKRGSGIRRDDDFDVVQIPSSHDATKILQIHDLLDKLAQEDARVATVCELRFFVGYELEEIAEKMELSLATVKRDLAFAKAWLKTEI